MNLTDWMNLAADAAAEIATGALGMATTRWEHTPDAAQLPLRLMLARNGWALSSAL